MLIDPAVEYTIIRFRTLVPCCCGFVWLALRTPAANGLPISRSNDQFAAVRVLSLVDL